MTDKMSAGPWVEAKGFREYDAADLRLRSVIQALEIHKANSDQNLVGCTEVLQDAAKIADFIMNDAREGFAVMPEKPEVSVVYLAPNRPMSADAVESAARHIQEAMQQ